MGGSAAALPEGCFAVFRELRKSCKGRSSRTPWHCVPRDAAFALFAGAKWEWPQPPPPLHPAVAGPHPRVAPPQHCQCVSRYLREAHDRTTRCCAPVPSALAMLAFSCQYFRWLCHGRICPAGACGANSSFIIPKSSLAMRVLEVLVVVVVLESPRF